MSVASGQMRHNCVGRIAFFLKTCGGLMPFWGRERCAGGDNARSRQSEAAAATVAEKPDNASTRIEERAGRRRPGTEANLSAGGRCQSGSRPRRGGAGRARVGFAAVRRYARASDEDARQTVTQTALILLMHRSTSAASGGERVNDFTTTTV